MPYKVWRWGEELSIFRRSSTNLQEIYAMPHKQMKETLAELKSEVSQTPVETTRFEETLEHAKEGIERYTPEAVQELVQILQREADELEVEHPRITAMINQVMTSLSNLGI
jgi:hypothetical protein